MAKAPARVPLPFAGAFLAFGLLGLAIGVGTGWASWRRLANARQAEGTVVELVRIAAGKGILGKGQATSSKPGLAPLVEYQVGGRTYHVRGQVSSSSCPYGVGDTVTVLYSLDRPSDGKIDCFSESWLAPLIFGAAGLVFTLSGLGMLSLRRNV